MLGGATGNALGACVRGMTLAEIRDRFGPNGIQEYAPTYGRLGAITADTQMSMFTAEGLLRAHVRQCAKGICHTPGVVRHAYLRWLRTQGERSSAGLFEDDDVKGPDGWLIGERALWARRAPGKTSLKALATEGVATNDSKGCGALARVAPVGLVSVARGHEGQFPAFELGEAVARLTHGHQAASLAGGALAQLIAFLTEGRELHEAVEEMHRILVDAPGSGFVTRSVDLALNFVSEGVEPTPESVERLGTGRTAEEALAITLYCALMAKDFEHGIRLAVNHSGDSDSVGALVGNVLGTALGVEAIPTRWLDELELRAAIETLAVDLVALRTGEFDAEAQWDRYPGW
jgi:ADP-ribosylglycohydrolase